ncbi:MAG: fibronectin type III domain-containing protein [Verrucomicrobia bacterium]|nr:fibronectin type III domain-containing protein [Verrucomicrobiota bacterium]
MKGLLNPSDRNSLVRFFGGAFSRRQLTTVTLGAFASLLFAPCGAFALSTATVELSPIVAKSTLLSAVDPSKEITVLLALPLSDAKGAAELAEHVSTKGDPLFHHFLTPQEFAARFGANAADYEAVKAWAIANGLKISYEGYARTILNVRGTAAQLQTLFRTQLNNYRSPKGDEFYSASIRPIIPDEISGKVTSVLGLTEGVQLAPQFKIGKTLGENPETPAIRTDTAGGTGIGGTYSPSDLRKAYLVPEFGALAPQTVALFEQGGFVKTDVEKFLTHYGLPTVPIKDVPVGGSDTKANGASVEVVLDIDAVIAINPSIKEVLVYIADYQTIPFSVGLVDAFDQVASDGKAQTLSVSYGTDEVVQGFSAADNEYTALLGLAEVGVTVVVSAGDDGAYGRTGTDTFPATLNAPDPGSQPLVTSVGGTTLFTYVDQQYLGEEVWNDLGIGDGATGGGVSGFWSRPFYQPSSLVTLNGGSSSARNVPDVGALANPLTGFGIYVKAAGGWIQIGGTSLSAPLWGGYISILNAGLQYLTGVTTPEIGFFNPILYATVPASAFPAGLLYPVLDGSNGNVELYGTAGFNAGPYYNNCTGVGSLWGPFAYDVFIYTGTGTPTPPVAPANLVAKATATSVKITWTKSTGATGYAVFVTAIQGGSTSFASQTFLTKGSKINVTGLTSGQEYGIAVSAVNTGGANLSETTVTTP